ncbi:hypothetical protein SAMN04487948_12264 [Halogranum amylolyticum]|uniref:Uncharacterized protein n=1 Tax=Halogranum amylolyticum TaxID=660520 RepID=A0A1H8W315_9EURY|nr:hypothetical protein SAMN04487948_12264 [Halogranum amylolyticum]
MKETYGNLTVIADDLQMLTGRNLCISYVEFVIQFTFVESIEGQSKGIHHSPGEGQTTASVR